MKQTVCYKRTTTANVTILRVSNETYMGSLNLMVWFNGSTLPIEGTVNIDDSNKQLMLKLESSGELILTFVAANDLSSQFQDIQVNVASELLSSTSTRERTTSTCSEYFPVGRHCKTGFDRKSLHQPV